jgi:hypothetical protein
MKLGKKFYIKKNLAGYVKELPEWAVNPDYLALKKGEEHARTT